MRSFSLHSSLFTLLLLSTISAGAAELAVDPVNVLATFDPREAFGATIDMHDRGENDRIFTAPNVDAMLSAGFQPLSYRLATELDGEAWHWNPEGTWSEPAKAQGYWTSSSVATQPIGVSYGYRLPRRGNTLDQSRNDSYSRVDDGDPTTFWKSNPYLESSQWCMVDLGAERSVQVIRIQWASPFATRYSVQRWSGANATANPIDDPVAGRWLDFPGGVVVHGRGGKETIRLAAEPVRTRYVRIVMTASSRTPVAVFTGGETAGDRATENAADPRHSTGFAVAEVSILDERGRDLMRHGTSRASQSIVWTSSTDPWHRAIDIDHSVEQLGLDRAYDLGLTRGLPMLVPVAMLYGTPEDAAAEIRYLRSRERPLLRIEMGEEPDGQFLSPEDYASLYLRWADALHAVDSSLQLGGPAFQSTNDVIAYWPDASGRTSWIGRFVDALRAAGRLPDLSFFSFEWYPFDKLCVPAQQQLVLAPSILNTVLANWRKEGLPVSIPWLATEYGYSSYAGEAEVSLPGALFNVEFVAQFLSQGGGAAYFYGLEPDVLIRELTCPTWGNLILFSSDSEHRILQPVAAFHAARLMTQEWTMGSGRHAVHPVAGTTKLLTAYALHRPDGRWSVLAINKSPTSATRIRLRLAARRIASAEV
ncbi:MAG: discoidin domain-containing protein, partial [Acidobacteriota bacterium]